MSAFANVGGADRAFRACFGLVLVALPFVVEIALRTNPVAKWMFVAVGCVLFATALLRFCPLYGLFGASTRRTAVR